MSSEPLFFADSRAWRRWLEKNHAKVEELWVGFHKRGTGTPSITWPESVDQALCFGWIDGVRKRIDESAYKIRFTPRKPGSTWSAINIKRAKELIEEGLLTPAGLAAFEKRTSERSAIYSYEQRKSAVLPKEYQARLEANAAAWAFFQSQPPWYRRASIHWIVSAKQEPTKLRRLQTLIKDSEQGKTIPPLTRR